MIKMTVHVLFLFCLCIALPTQVGSDSARTIDRSQLSLGYPSAGQDSTTANVDDPHQELVKELMAWWLIRMKKEHRNTYVAYFGQYMIHDAIQKCEDSSFPGWEGFPLLKCTYRENGQTVSAIMLNPEPERLAHWIVDACQAAGHPNIGCAKQMFGVVRGQSGVQFAVAGIVLEDQYPIYIDDTKERHPNTKDFKAGIFENYCFRSGITIGVKALQTKRTDVGKVGRIYYRPEGAYSSEQVDNCYNAGLLTSLVLPASRELPLKIITNVFCTSRFKKALCG